MTAALKRGFVVMFLAGLWLVPQVTLAQDGVCEDVARHHVCNAGGLVEIEGAPAAGDSVGTVAVQSVVTHAVEEGEAAPPPPEIDVTVNSGANVRGGPSTGESVVGGLAAGDVVTANGRIADNSWLRILLGEDGIGWIFAQLVTPGGDVNQLDVVDPAEPFNVMPTSGRAVMSLQADFPEVIPIYNVTLLLFGDASVENASSDAQPFHSMSLSTGASGGVLLQTPNNAGAATVTLNGTPVELIAATVLASANPDLMLSVLDGLIFVGADGARQAAPEGSQIDVGAGTVTAYDNGFDDLPPGSLPRTFEIAPPAADLDAAGTPNSGLWMATFGVGVLACGDEFVVPEERLAGTIMPRILTVGDTSIDLSGVNSPDVLAQPTHIEPHLYQTGENVVSEDPLVTDMLTWWVVSPEKIQGWEVITQDNECVTSVPFELIFGPPE